MPFVRATSCGSPDLVPFLLRHATIGFGLGIGFVAMLLAVDVGRLGTLVQAAPGGWLGAGLLAFLMGLTFGSLQMGFAVMGLAEHGERTGSDPRALVRRRARS